jgi:hypothetical protein
MADQEKDKRMQIDKVLDSLLAGYSSVEPRPGLETRILANLRDAEEKKASQGWWNFKWLWAGAVAAVIIIAAVLISGRHQIAPPTNNVVKNTQTASQPESQTHAPIAPEQVGKIHRRKPPVPTRPQNATLALSERPAVFPTPTPLSEQEKLLLSYLVGTPREEVIAQSHPDEPPVVGDQDQTETIPDLMHIPQKVSNTR